MEKSEAWIIRLRKSSIRDAGFPTLSSFADAVGEDVTNISKIILGKQKPRIEKLFKWATILDCDINKLLLLYYPEEMDKNMSEACTREMKKGGFYES